MKKDAEYSLYPFLLIWRVDFDENLVYTYQQMRKEEERADMERLDK